MGGTGGAFPDGYLAAVYHAAGAGSTGYRISGDTEFVGVYEDPYE